MKSTVKRKYSSEELKEIILSTVREVVEGGREYSEKEKRLKAREREEEKYKAQRKKASMAGLDSLARGVAEAPVKVPSTDDPHELRTLLAKSMMKIRELEAELQKWKEYGAKMKGVKTGMDTEQCLNFVNTVEKATKGNLHGKK